MTQPRGHHLAGLNVGLLSRPTDDPRVADMGAHDRMRTYLKEAQAWKTHGCAQVAVE